mgnify:CR=1 FL=1|tara:strand:- start:108 stop:626 length:519 start_codon:yes stop_codon:yes gene_type:complete
MSQEGIDVLIEEQGNATATLHENAAGARQQSQTNGKEISRIFYLLIIVVLLGSAGVGLSAIDEYKQLTIINKHISKNFYQAVAFDLSGKKMKFINARINKMFEFDYITTKEMHKGRSFAAKANELGAKRVAEALKLRFELLDDREAFEAIQQMSRAIKSDPEGWNAFVNEQK